MISLLTFSLAALATPALDAPTTGATGTDAHDVEPLPEGVLLDEADSDGIINGTVAAVDNWPQAGALLIETEFFGTPFVVVACSSTLIAPDTVLLAAHCIDPTVYESQFIDIDQSTLWWTRQADLTGYATGQQTTVPTDAVPVVGRVQHEGFSISGMQMGIAQNDDIALLFLGTALTEVPLAVLPTAEEAAHVVPSAPVAVVGWGQSTTEQTSAGQKMHGTSHIAELGTHELKVGEVVGDVRKCHGDSGGPSFLEIETDALDTWRQIGVTSHAYDASDCNETGGVDTRVDAYLDWIDAQMVAGCTAGTRVWCDSEQGIIPPPMPEEEEEAARACGCSASPTSGLAWAWLGLPILLRRRR